MARDRRVEPGKQLDMMSEAPSEVEAPAVGDPVIDVGRQDPGKQYYFE